jgi:hypothetical protein
MFITLQQSVRPQGLLIPSRCIEDGLRRKLYSTPLENKSMLEFCEDDNKTSDYKERSVFLDQPSYQTFPTNLLYRV